MPRARPVALMYKDADQLVGDALPPIREGRGRRQVRAVRAQKGCQVEAGLEGHVACQLDEVWSEALEMDSKGVGGCVDVQGLVSCLVPTHHNVKADMPNTDESGVCGLSSSCTDKMNSDTTCFTETSGCAEACELFHVCHSRCDLP